MPGTLNLTVYTGDDFAKQLDFDDGTNPIDLSGYTNIRAQIRSSADSSTITESFTVDTTDAVTGTLVLTLTDTETAALTAGSFVWDLEWTTDLSMVQTILAGRCTITQDVTR